MHPKTHAWKGWYTIHTDDLAVALRTAHSRAHDDHPTTPPGAMMTPQIRLVSRGVRVMVIGKPLVADEATASQIGADGQ